MKNFKKWTKIAAVVLFVLGMASNAHAQKLARYSVELGGQSTKAAQGGFLDLKTGTVHGLKDATQNQGNIDLLYVHSKGSGVNLMAPSATILKQFSRYNKGVVEVWETKNSARIVLLGKDKKHRKTFSRAKTNAHLEKAYNDAAAEVKTRDDYKVSKYGPSARLANVEVGDYIVYRSRGGDRNVYAMARVTDIKPGLAGSVSLDVKSTK